MKKTENDIAEQIANQQEWPNIQDTYNFPDTRNMLTVQFECVRMADKALNQGLNDAILNNIFPFRTDGKKYVREFCIVKLFIELVVAQISFHSLG